MIKNPSNVDLRFSFTYGMYPENLNVSVSYSHFMPVRVPRGDEMQFGLVYWVSESNVSLSLIDLWFDMEMS